MCIVYNNRFVVVFDVEGIILSFSCCILQTNRAFGLRCGDTIGVAHQQDHIREAYVMEKLQDRVLVRYKGLDANHDEYVMLHDPRIRFNVGGTSHRLRLPKRLSSVNPAETHSRMISTGNPQYDHYCESLQRQSLQIYQVYRANT